MRPGSLIASSMFGVVLATAVAAQGATITWSGTGNKATMATFTGDPSVPNVTIRYPDQAGTFDGSPTLNLWNDGYGPYSNDVDASLYPDWQGPILVLEADPGWSVVLHSIEVAMWAGGDGAIDITVEDGAGNVLFDQQGISMTALGTYNLVDFGGISAPKLVISVGSSTTSHGLNNLTYDQIAIPEPASLALMGMGAALMLRRRQA